MAGKRYDPKTKAAFMKAAQEARAAGKTWAKAHEAAKAAGYSGSRPGLVQMFISAAGKRGGKRAGKKAIKAGGNLQSIEQMIDQLATARVKSAIEKAIAALQQAIK